MLQTSYPTSFISWRLQLTHQLLIIADREVRRWERVNKDKFREVLLQSELCKWDQRPDTVEEYFDVFHNTLQSLADEFAPVPQITIRRQRLAIWIDEQCIALRRKSRMLERRYRRTQKSEDRLAWVSMNGNGTASTGRRRVLSGQCDYSSKRTNRGNFGAVLRP